MKKMYLLLGFFIVATSMVGCANQSTPVDQTQEVQESTQNIPTPYSVISEEPSSPYPSVEQSSEGLPSIITPEAYPRVGEVDVEQESTPENLATPTLPIDIVMRATDPDQFNLTSGGYQLVEFFDFWCPTCKSMAPVLRKLENKYAGKIQFIYLDIDDPKTNPFKQALGYQYQPHLFLIDGQGVVIKQWVGYVAEEELDVVLGSIQ